MAIAAGGTAGHITVAVAVAEAYRRLDSDVALLFLGTPKGLERRLLPGLGYRLEMVAGSPLAGEGLGGKVRALASVSMGIVQARHRLRDFESRLVIGLGGYASAGVVLAARSLGLATAIHESNLVPGLANRLLAKVVDRIYVGHEQTGRALPGLECLVTGNPVRPEFLAPERPVRADRDPLPARVLVTGGSHGSPFLNRHAPELLRRIADLGISLEIRHQSGLGRATSVEGAYRRAELRADVAPFIEDMAAAHRWADFAIACAGAGTLVELAASGLPSLLVPLSGSAGDHQRANAEAFAADTGALCITEGAWERLGTDALAVKLLPVFSDAGAWEDASARVRKVATPDAAGALVADCERLMAGRW